MNRMWILTVIVAYPVVLLAQTGSSGTLSGSSGTYPPYQPAVPAPSINAYSGWSGYSGGGSTPAGSALNGMAHVISAKGDYNLATSAAAVNMTQAQRNDIQNRQMWTNAYFGMRAANRAAHQAERGSRPTMEQLVIIARLGAPKPLGPDQMDPVSGKLNWPGVLREAGFDSQRGQVDQLFAILARYGGLGYSDQTKVHQTLDAMLDELKAQVRDIPPRDYVACRSFLQSLSYAATQTDL